ncbi:hypothetical protein E1258_31410 [Micromonospora sp. KC207]|uniref:hypothetical protein n=1 Tax=Micromonospora sp. KC207 TaxID=2530377 RepID=UPI001053D5B5|nr:hypothetical protein [Micromonospora sp. KC207]TDC44673.1 hypothetical protein E1258_31410 [Micromonospora sp. KC207]
MRGTLTTIAILAAAALAYPLSCAVRPYRDCWVCKGSGHHRATGNRKLSRPCRWCRATGKRLRLGRRAWNRARRIHRDAT